MSRHQTEQARAALRSLAASGVSRDDFSLGVIDIVGRAVPYDSMCFATTDPSTGLFTGTMKRHLDERDELNYAFAVHEYSFDDVNQFIDLARRPDGVGVLRDDTAGDPHRSERYRGMLKPHFDAEHELRAVARANGSMWGAYALYRSAGSSGFSPAEADFLSGVESVIAAGIRTSLIASAARSDGDPLAPSVLMFDGAGEVVQATPTADEYLHDLGGRSWENLPVPVASVVSAVRSQAGTERWDVPRLRVRGKSGCWYLLHASPFPALDGSGLHVVVTIEQAGPPEIIPLLIAAYGLTAREGDVLRGVLKGDSTRAIAADLHISAYTVQDYLKTIFDKTGVSSRRALVAQVFFAHQVERYGAVPRPSGSNVAVTPSRAGPAAHAARR
jgi:DNA-binding CsgD family transcriptional regulator